jgi:hypothetical protein
MTLTQAVFIALMGFSPSVHDQETTEQRTRRLQIAAEAIGNATARAMCLEAWAKEDCRRAWRRDRRELAAALIALGHFETKYAQYVGEGRCHDGPRGQRCDDGNARTYWQTWAVACPDAWKASPGSREEVEAGAWCAARLLSGAYNFCKEPAGDGWARAFGRYGGRACGWDGGAERAKLMRKIQSKL